MGAKVAFDEYKRNKVITASGVELKYLWPTKQELQLMKEYEEVRQLSLQSLLFQNCFSLQGEIQLLLLEGFVAQLTTNMIFKFYNRLDHL